MENEDYWRVDRCFRQWRTMAAAEGREARSILDGTFFEPLENESTGSTLKAECKLCGKVLSGSRTSTLHFVLHLDVVLSLFDYFFLVLSLMQCVIFPVRQ